MKDDETDTGDLPRDPRLPFVQTLRLLRDTRGTDLSLIARFGELWVARIFGRTAVCAASPDLAGEVLLDRKRNFSSRYGWEHFLGEVSPRGLMLRDFDEHQSQRRILQVAFREPARRAYHPLIANQTKRTLDAWAARGGERFRFYPAIKQALLEQASSVFLGVPLGERAQLLTRNFVRMVDATVAPLRLNLPLTAWRRGLRAREQTSELLRAEIPARRGGEGKDIFSMLCNAHDDEGVGFDDEEVVEHTLFLLHAAHDTTATALCTLVEQLVIQRDWQARLREECRAGADEGLTFDHLQELEQIDWAFREALRINPPVAYIPRRSVRTCPLGHHQLRPKVALSVIVRGCHYDESLWSNPHEFDPERFAPERAEDRNHPHAFIPFGGGVHRCIGAEFARQQSKVFVHQLLTRFELRCPPGREPSWQGMPLPRPRDGLPIGLREL